MVEYVEIVPAVSHQLGKMRFANLLFHIGEAGGLSCFARTGKNRNSKGCAIIVHT